MEREYVYTWSLTERIVHWVIALAVAVLTLTGFYIHWPFVEGGAPGGVGVMAWMRFTILLLPMRSSLHWLSGSTWPSLLCSAPIGENLGCGAICAAYRTFSAITCS